MKRVMIALGVIWLGFAIAIQWGGAPLSVFYAVAGNTTDIAHGQIWRIFTAAWVHPPDEFGPILFSILGIYLLGSTLEKRWGGKRFVRFLLFSGWLAYFIQFVVLLILPSSLTARLERVDGYWSGAFPMVEACAMAWALSYRDQQAQFGTRPVSTKFLVWFVIGITVLWVGIGVSGGQAPSEGVVAPLAGLFTGWFFGGGTPSPARRLVLKYRLARLEREQRSHASARKRRVAKSGLEVIPGGKSEKRRPRDGGGGGKGPSNGSGAPPDKSLLN